MLKNNTSPDTRAYLKFNLTGISGNVTKATFRAFTQTSSGSGYELHSVADNSWVEPGLTYSNRPAVGGTIGTAVNFTANTWTSVDASTYVKTPGTYSFEMNGTSTSLKQYSSKEGANPPQLVIQYTPVATPASLTAVAGDGQSATVGTAFATQLAVKALDASSQPVAGASVSFSAPASGASAAFAGGARTVSVTTGANGVATAPQLVANATAGAYQVSASTNGVSSPVTFNLTNTRRSAARHADCGGRRGFVRPLRCSGEQLRLRDRPDRPHQPGDRQLRQVRRVRAQRHAAQGRVAALGRDDGHDHLQGVSSCRQQLDRERSDVQQQAGLRRPRRNIRTDHSGHLDGPRRHGSRRRQRIGHAGIHHGQHGRQELRRRARTRRTRRNCCSPRNRRRAETP